jgi:hypothetical protein
MYLSHFFKNTFTRIFVLFFTLGNAQKIFLHFILNVIVNDFGITFAIS